MRIVLFINFDGLVKSRKNPSPSMGEGWGEGEKGCILTTYLPPPLNPLLSEPEATRGGELGLFTSLSTLRYEQIATILNRWKVHRDSKVRAEIV
jgi:hypothetical protein